MILRTQTLADIPSEQASKPCRDVPCQCNNLLRHQFLDIDEQPDYEDEYSLAK